MDNSDGEKTAASCEDGSQVSRNRSFKSKQLVRSQAIRESQSPPRTGSPAAAPGDGGDANDERTVAVADGDASSHLSDRCSDVDTAVDDTSNSSGDGCKAQPVEIQITHGGWESESQSEQRARTKRWLTHKRHSDCRDLLSKDPRLVCVCGACAACPHCRGRKQRQRGPTKQDSGIVVSDECPDCSDSEQPGSVNGDGHRKSSSLDVEEQYYSCRCTDRKDRPKNISLSRYDSDDREPTGPDLVNFIKETLNKSGKDRSTLLKIEKELNAFINDTGRCVIRFPVMTSYGRMLVHRCAALFQLSHHLDQVNKNTVIVSKSGTSGGRIPCTGFSEWCTVPYPMSPSHHQSDNVTYAKSILKRDTQSLDEGSSASRVASRSKSLEQREREYERVRRRIFSTDNCNRDDSQWRWSGAGPVKVLAPEGRNKLLKVQSLESGRGQNPSWRSKGAVAKSHSFGGYGGGEQPQPRVLSRQGVASPESVCSENRAMMYTVTDVSAVPPGAVVLQAQSGQPLMNPDGTIYHYDPANPPVFYDGNVYMLADTLKDMNNDKRRPRLEKQNSFIDSESADVKSQNAEYHPSEECRSRCACECRRGEAAQQANGVYTPSVQAEQKSSAPTSPSKSRNDPRNTTEDSSGNPTKLASHSSTEPTNHIASAETIPKPVYEAPPNPRSYEPSKNQYETTSSQQRYDEGTNSKTYDNANKKAYDVAQTQKNVYDGSNSKTYERHFEGQRTETHQRPASYDPRPSSYEPAHHNRFEAARVAAESVPPNQRHAPKLTKQESQDLQQYLAQQSYMQGYRNDETTSPHLVNHAYMNSDIANLQNLMMHKVTPVPMPDPNLRPMSLTNVMYPGPMQGYPFINQQCRMEPSLQPAVFQSLMQHQVEEQKQIAASPHANESTFRIDPSYPYAPVEYAPPPAPPQAPPPAPCGACVDPAVAVQPRSYNVSYPMEMQPTLPAVMPPPTYPIMPPMQHYPYQEAMQWPGMQPVLPVSAPPAKLYVPELCPVIQYPQYNVLYPQMIPQSYPYCQPLYPAIEKPPEAARRNSLRSKQNSARGTPLNTPPRDTTHEEGDKGYKGDPEIAAKIQQIKDQMAQLNTKERGGRAKPDDLRRRNSGTGILGSYPVGSHVNNRAMGPVNDETQLTSTARAIVNSIRNMHPKNNYYDNRRTVESRIQDRSGRSERDPKPDPRLDRRGVGVPFIRPSYLFRQMSTGTTWCRRSPAPIHPVLNHPRRSQPDNKNGRR